MDDVKDGLLVVLVEMSNSSEVQVIGSKLEALNNQNAKLEGDIAANSAEMKKMMEMLLKLLEPSEN